MERVVKIRVPDSREPSPAIFIVEMKMQEFPRVEQRPAVCWIDTSGKLRHTIHGMHFVPSFQQPPDYMPSDKTGTACH